MHRHWVQFTFVRRGYDNHTCHNKSQIEKWDWNVNDVMPGSDGLRIWGFWKRRQFGVDCGPVQLGVDFGPCKTDDLVSAFGHREVEV